MSAKAAWGIVAGAGARYIGCSEGYAWFNEPASGSTTLIPLDSLTADAVRVALQGIRERFGG